jgi:HlyD family secretion protein
MRAAVDEENIARAAVGQRVKMTLYSFPGTTFDGVVERKYPKADAARRTFDIDVGFLTAEPRLQPGMTGELAFIEKTLDRALIVPAQAVQNGVIWTIRNGRLTAAEATVGIRGIERAEVVAGLGLGDVIVISPIGDLHPGQRVRIGTVLDPKVAADLNKPREVTFKGFQ